MNNDGSNFFGIVGDSRKHKFERKANIEISYVTDGSFVLRAITKIKYGKVKRIEENFKTSDEICLAIKHILDSNVESLDDIIVEKRKITLEEEKNKIIEKIKEKQELIKGIYKNSIKDS